MRVFLAAFVRRCRLPAAARLGAVGAGTLARRPSLGLVLDDRVLADRRNPDRRGLLEHRRARRGFDDADRQEMSRWCANSRAYRATTAASRGTAAPRAHAHRRGRDNGHEGWRLSGCQLVTERSCRRRGSYFVIGPAPT